MEAQRNIATEVPFSEASMLGSHNTYNSREYRNALRYLDPQQIHSIYDQLKLGARFIELDAHWTYKIDGFDWGNDLLLCHSGIGASIGDLHVGCSVADRRLSDGLEEVSNWLNENPEEVIILYIEDHVDGEYQKLWEVLQSKLGEKFYKSNGCSALPNSLSPQEVLKAGKQVVLWKDGGCSNYAPLANTAFTGLGGMSRVWEDRTGIGAIGEVFGGTAVSRLEADDIRREFNSGRNLVNLDDLTYDDGRLEAGIWSWDQNEPNNGGDDSIEQDCAVQWQNGRWDDQGCDMSYFHACKSASTGAWQLSSYAGTWRDGASACAALPGDYRFALPKSAADNQALINAKGGQTHAWINFSDRLYEGNWRETITESTYRELRDGRSNLCLDVEWGQASNGTNVRLWECNGDNAQKWRYDHENGQLKSALGLCLDNRGHTHDGGEIVIWECLDIDNLKFDWVGHTLRNRHNHDFVLDAYGDESGDQVGQWRFHGGSNQQWFWGN